MADKMKRHNARQSAQRLTTEICMLRLKIARHLDNGGLFQTEFAAAENELSEAAESLNRAVEVLSS